MEMTRVDQGLRDQVARHFSEAFRLIGRAAGADAHGEGPGWHRVQTGLPHFLANMAIVDSGEDIASLQAAVEPLVSPTRPASVIFVSSDVSSEAASFLKGNGFEHLGGMPLMTVPIDRLPETDPPEGVEIARVGKDELAAWGTAMAEGYGIPLEMGACCAALIEKEDVEAYAALENGRMVSTSMVYLHDGLAGIYCVATLPEARGRGLGRHLTAYPLRRAAEKGYTTGILQSSEMGYSVYRKLGFEEVGAVPVYARIIGPSHGPS